MRRTARAGLVAALVLLQGCALVTTLRGPAVGFTPFVERRSELTGLCDWKGVIHCHSYLSHDSEGTVAEITGAADRVGLDFLVMTDHQSTASIEHGLRGVIGRTLYVTGAEVRAKKGSLLMFPLRELVERGETPDMIAATHAQGGLAFAGHAELFVEWDLPDLDGIEIVNLHAAALMASKVKLVLSVLFLPVRYTFVLLDLRPDEVLARWDQELSRRHPFTPIGGNDAHQNIKLLGPLGGTIGTYEELFKLLTTHVLAPDLTEESLVDALRRGRSYVAFDLYRDGTGFEFVAECGDSVAVMGDTVTRAADLRLVVQTPAAGEIRLLRDGQVVGVVTGSQLELLDPEPGVYRVEVMAPTHRPWLWSSSIRVLAAE